MSLRASLLAGPGSLLLLVAVTLSGASGTQAAQIVASPQCGGASAIASAPHHAGLVVTFGDRTTMRFCVEFAEDSITGLQLLERSGLPVVTSGTSLGAAVCSIDGQGSNDPTNCFADCTGSSCAYWAYYQFADDAWKFSSIGASQRVVYDGDIDGWAWGPGGQSSGAIPEQPGVICPTPTPTPMPTIANPSPTPRPTWTPQPTSTVVATPPGTVMPVPTSGAIAEPPASTAAPQDAAPAGAVTPLETRGSNVEGAERPATTPPPASPSVTAFPTSTPQTGVVVVGADQGKRNESGAQATGSGGGGNRASLIVFGAVAVALLAGGGAVMYRRRRIG